MIKLVLTDLDNTLIPHRPDESFWPTFVSEEAVDAIRQLLDVGIHFGPVTGRPVGSLSETFRGEERAHATGAYANGQLVCVDGQIIHREWTPQEPLQRVLDILEEQEDGLLVLFDMEGSGQRWGISHDEAKNERFRNGDWFVPKLLPSLDGPSLKAIVRVIEGPHMTERLRDMLRAEVPELDFVLPSRDATVIDITPKGYGKGSAVRIMADYLGLGLDEVAAFGDSENDLSMLETVPNSVAVANATPEAAAASRWHIGDALDESVAHALLDIATAARRGEMPAFMR